MGNNSSKDSGHSHRGTSYRVDEGASESNQHLHASQQSSSERVIGIYGPGVSSSRRGSRHEIPFLHLTRDRSAEQQQTAQRPKETRQEKEARRAERERQARLKERERSVRDESVDGGFLVTLGTYTGPEDFSKPVVRQLQIERRLAPFWKGLNDHSDSWTEYQLVAAVRGLPIPAADEVPGALLTPASPTSAGKAQSPVQQVLPVPVTTQATTGASSTSQLSSSHPATSGLAPLSPLGTSPLFRGRAKTLATLASGSRIGTPDMTPQEIQLPPDPNVNGLPIEAYLYREPGECPICFLYYPPYLNKTRCCDQPICSECFVQIKRPDPHLPEHEQPGQPRQPEEHAELLVSEVAACPFCVAPEFGITYQPPPFRRGIMYANQAIPSHAANLKSAASSRSSVPLGERRRTISISASAPEVVTTDMVRPDWAKKLADARAHALRRSAAATALHNAAYVLGAPEGGLRHAYGRRRRTLFMDSPAGSGSHSPREGEDGSSDLFPGRTSSRRNRVEDLEDLMMMEAIRLSLAAEEERKRKEHKDKQKDEKKKAKEAKKEAKQLEKLARKNGGSSSSIYKLQSNDSVSTWASSSMVRSSSNLGSQPMIMEEEVQGKGKAPVHSDSQLGDQETQMTAASSSTTGDAKRHLETSRANIQSASNPITMPQHRHHLRQLSNASSLASSFVDSTVGSLHADSPSPSPSGLDGYHGSGDGSPFRSGTPSGTTGSLEPMLNFQSLAAMIDNEGKAAHSEHIEHIQDEEKLARAEEELKGQSPTASPATSVVFDGPRRNRGNSGGSSVSARMVGTLDGQEHDTAASARSGEQAQAPT